MSDQTGPVDPSPSFSPTPTIRNTSSSESPTRPSIPDTSGESTSSVKTIQGGAKDDTGAVHMRGEITGNSEQKAGESSRLVPEPQKSQNLNSTTKSYPSTTLPSNNVSPARPQTLPRSPSHRFTSASPALPPPSSFSYASTRSPGSARQGRPPSSIYGGGGGSSIAESSGMSSGEEDYAGEETDGGQSIRQGTIGAFRSPSMPGVPRSGGVAQARGLSVPPVDVSSGRAGGGGGSGFGSPFLTPGTAPPPGSMSQQSAAMARAGSSATSGLVRTPKMLPRANSHLGSMGGNGVGGGMMGNASGTRSVSKSRGKQSGRRDEDDEGSNIVEDDEVKVRDRGEDLIRRRLKERKKAKRMASKGMVPTLGTPGTMTPTLGPVGPDVFGHGRTPQEEEENAYALEHPDDQDNGEGEFGTSLTSVPPTPDVLGSYGALGGESGTGRRLPSTPYLSTGMQSRSQSQSRQSSRAPSRTRGASGANTRPNVMGYFPPYEEAAFLPPPMSRSGSPNRLSHGTEGEGSTTPMMQTRNQIEISPMRDHFSHLRPPGGPGPSRPGSIMDEVINEVVRSEAGSLRQDRLDEAEGGNEEEGDPDDDDGSGGDEDADDEGLTLRDRQDAINIEHPFGLPIWKPALYRKSRSVTRNAERALHAIPSAAAERHLLPGNIMWTLIFGWWLALWCLFFAGLVWIAEAVGGGNAGYASALFGLGWYIWWPFGKYLEGEGRSKRRQHILEQEALFADDEDAADFKHGNEHSADVDHSGQRIPSSSSGSSTSTHTIRKGESTERSPAPGNDNNERQPLLAKNKATGHAHTVTFAQSAHDGVKAKHYGAASHGNGNGNGNGYVSSDSAGSDTLVDTAIDSASRNASLIARMLGAVVYWLVFGLFIAPALGTVCLLCWGMVITIPMAKLTWALLRYMARRPLTIKYRSAPKIAVVSTSASPDVEGEDPDVSGSGFTIRQPRLKAGQLAPTSGPESTILLCAYRAVGLQYYKYTVGGVNIMFVNLLPLVFFTIFDGLVMLPYAEHHGVTNPLLKLLTSQALVFILSIASVIPLSYFIGMAVASISAQSSIGMGAVINATFGSIIEIILYSIALTQGKGKLVEGSIIGSILAGVLLMPGASMCSGAFKRKEQRFNAKSAGVTSTMLIMAIIGALTPTLFYQTYGSFTLRCDGCPDGMPKADSKEPWLCTQCTYDHPDPATDPFYQDQVKTLMYFCAVILVLSYLIGLWFSLRTHASQIWQNPQQLMRHDEIPSGAMHPAVRTSAYQRLTPQAMLQQVLPTHRGSVDAGPGSKSGTVPPTPAATGEDAPPQIPQESRSEQVAHEQHRKDSNATVGPGEAPSTDRTVKDLRQSSLDPMQLPPTLTTEDFTRAVAAATVTALKHHATQLNMRRPVQGGAIITQPVEEEEHGGHDGPSWSRAVSAGVLMSCTVLYAVIAEILVDVVDVVLDGSGIDEKFLGVTLFALVPNTTEFMNAMSFALNGNIALSMEIGSAYALQVCLLQIPAMVAFSALYDPQRLGQMTDTFTLIFPRWDVIAIILSIFLLTYTYIEARSNYHRGSILILAYLVLVSGFYFAPVSTPSDALPIDPATVIRGSPLSLLAVFGIHV